MHALVHVKIASARKLSRKVAAALGFRGASRHQTTVVLQTDFERARLMRMVQLDVDRVVDRCMRLKEPLRQSSNLDSWHLLLAPSNDEMAVFSTVVVALWTAVVTLTKTITRATANNAYLCVGR